MRSRLCKSVPSSPIGLHHLAVATALVVAGLAASAVAQVRMVNWNIARLNGDPQAIEEVFVAMADDDVPGFATAPAILILQEVTNSARVSILNANIPTISFGNALILVPFHLAQLGKMVLMRHL